jgi:UDP-N-acetylglucosamine 4-epimerase
LGSVPRSINDPITTNEVNINGFLNILMAAKESPTLIRMLYATSSSSFGNCAKLPRIQGEKFKTLSPYVVTKCVNKLYANVFSKFYGFHTIVLRYFIVFVRKQNPYNPYANVIPLFVKAAKEGQSPFYQR